MSSRKRKADELSDDPASGFLPHLPAPVWAHVLDFMPYTEVRSALLVGKHIAVKAARYVKALSVMKESEMHLPAARRFPNIEEVNVLCLLWGDGETNHAGVEGYTISFDAVGRTVPFLLGFAKLKDVFLGGLLKRQDGTGPSSDCLTFSSYVPDHCKGPANHVDIFRSLVHSFVSASKAGALPRNFHGMIYCLGPSSQIHPPVENILEGSSDCRWCQDVVTHFPLSTLLCYLTQGHKRPFCLPPHSVWDAALKRPGVEMRMKEMSERVLCGCLYSTVSMWYKPHGPNRTAAIERLKQRWGLEKETTVNVWDVESFEQLDQMASIGFDPKLISRRYSLNCLRSYIGMRTWSQLKELNCWTKSAVDGLSARGYPLDSQSIPVIDDEGCKNEESPELWQPAKPLDFVH